MSNLKLRFNLEWALISRSARGAGAVIISRRISEMINDKFLTLSKDTRILVYCWRGGLRSKSLAVILNQCGFNNLKLLKGGYKAFRNLVTSSLNEMIQSHQYMVLAGNTGSGKDVFRSSNVLLWNFVCIYEIAHHISHSIMF